MRQLVVLKSSMLHCHTVTIGTVGDHNLSSTITSNIYAVSLVVMTYLLEQGRIVQMGSFGLFRRKSCYYVVVVTMSEW